MRITSIIVASLGLMACTTTPHGVSRSLVHWQTLPEGEVGPHPNCEPRAQLPANSSSASFALTLTGADELGELPEDDAAAQRREAALLAEAALLSTVSYCNPPHTEYVRRPIWEGRIRATQTFNNLGFHAAYYHPNYNAFIRDPNLFVLGVEGSNRIIIVFPGTEAGSNWYDLVQNIRAIGQVDRQRGLAAHYESENPGDAYLPYGHRGFRNGARNLLEAGFIRAGDQITSLTTNCPEDVDTTLSGGGSFSLAQFICAYQIRGDAPVDRPTRVVVIGHSLGAGVAQMFAGAVHGLHWSDGEVSRRENWPYELERLYLIAPPLALYPRRVADENASQRRCSEIAWERSSLFTYERRGITERTVAVAREGDMVPALWNPRDGNCVVGEHFARYFYSIDRNGIDVRFLYVPASTDQPESRRLRLDQPHRPAQYRDALEAYVEGDWRRR